MVNYDNLSSQEKIIYNLIQEKKKFNVNDYFLNKDNKIYILRDIKIIGKENSTKIDIDMFYILEILRSSSKDEIIILELDYHIIKENFKKINIIDIK